MAKEVVRRIPLDGDKDFLDVRLYVERNRVVGFVLNYTAVIAGEERVVCRYDTCHGHLHVHRHWLEGRTPKDLEDPERPSKDYKAMVRAAEDDLRSNWREYRSRMEPRRAPTRGGNLGRNRRT